MRDYSSWQCWLCATKNNKRRTRKGHCSDREGPALTSYEYVIQNGVWQVFVVLQVVVLQNAENCTLNWLLWKQPKPNAVSHKPHISQCCSLPINAWPKGFRAKGCRQEHLLQAYTTHLPALSQGWPLCGQLCSTHYDPHLHTTWIFHIFHVQPQNVGQTMLVLMWKWDQRAFLHPEWLLEFPILLHQVNILMSKPGKEGEKPIHTENKPCFLCCSENMLVGMPLRTTHATSSPL